MEGLMLITLYLVIALACKSNSYSVLRSDRLTHYGAVWVS